MANGTRTLQSCLMSGQVGPHRDTLIVVRSIPGPGPGTRRRDARGPDGT